MGGHRISPLSCPEWPVVPRALLSEARREGGREELFTRFHRSRSYLLSGNVDRDRVERYPEQLRYSSPSAGTKLKHTDEAQRI